MLPPANSEGTGGAVGGPRRKITIEVDACSIENCPQYAVFHKCDGCNSPLCEAHAKLLERIRPLVTGYIELYYEPDTVLIGDVYVCAKCSTSQSVASLRVAYNVLNASARIASDAYRKIKKYDRIANAEPTAQEPSPEAKDA